MAAADAASCGDAIWPDVLRAITAPPGDEVCGGGVIMLGIAATLVSTPRARARSCERVHANGSNCTARAPPGVVGRVIVGELIDAATVPSSHKSTETKRRPHLTPQCTWRCCTPNT
jgi:hypothetical protein